MEINTRTTISGNKHRNEQKREKVAKADAMREICQINKQIELCTEYGDRWNALWDRKRQLSAILSIHND